MRTDSWRARSDRNNPDRIPGRRASRRSKDRFAGFLQGLHDPWCGRVTTLRARILVICVGLVSAPLLAETVAGRFVEVARDETSGHFFSQVIYARTTGELVSCGTRTHAKPIRAHETQPTSARTGVRSSRHRVST